MTQRTRAIHPFLIAPFPILLLYSRNLHLIDLFEIWLPIALNLGTVTLLWGILRGLRLDGPRASLIVSTGLLLCFGFGPAVRLVDHLEVVPNRLAQEFLALAIESLWLAGVVVLAIKTPDLARRSTGFLNASACALLALSILGIARERWEQPAVIPVRLDDRPIPAFHPPSGRLPDVYFLVLDAYGRSDALRRVIGFDNSAFLARLKQRGFFVADHGTANYTQTMLSLSATLNLRYLDDLAGCPSEDRHPLKTLITESLVFRSFRKLGYRVVRFDSGFDATDSIVGDLNLGPPERLRTFPSLVADQTPLWLILGSRNTYDPRRLHRQRILNVFENLPASSHPSDAPTFTFAHVVAPHPPFLFGADGRDYSEREGAYTLNDTRPEGPDGSAEYARRYRDQAAYLSARVEQVVERILSTSKVEPIIIIQGDHGSGSRFDANTPEPNDLFERMTVLNAIYLPETIRGEINPSISLVNTFRLVFDRGFGSKLGLLPDRSFYSPYPQPYLFREVTGQIHEPVR